MSDELVRSIEHGNILELKLDFEQTNTFSREALKALHDTLSSYYDDPRFKVLILSSASKKYFSNGLDPELFLGKSRQEIRDTFQYIFESNSALFRFPRPTIIRIEGHCMALAAVMAISCDYRFMTDRGGRIGFPESLISVNFPVISTVLLRDLVGPAKARDLLYTGRSLKPAEALEIGLVDEIFPSEEIEEKTLKFARKLANLTTESARGIKNALRKPYESMQKEVNEWDLDQIADTIFSQNGQEGFLSIKEGRRPVFPNP